YGQTPALTSRVIWHLAPLVPIAAGLKLARARPSRQPPLVLAAAAVGFAGAAALQGKGWSYHFIAASSSWLMAAAALAALILSGRAVILGMLAVVATALTGLAARSQVRYFRAEPGYTAALL